MDGGSQEVRGMDQEARFGGGSRRSKKRQKYRHKGTEKSGGGAGSGQNCREMGP